MSLLMEALKRAEREKPLSAQEQGGAGLDLEPDWRPGPEPLRDEGRFPSLEWAEPAPGDSAPAAAAFPAKAALSLEAPPPEPAPAETAAIPPVAPAEPAFCRDPAEARREQPAPAEAAAQRRQHAANILAATQKARPRRPRRLLPAAGAAAILLLAGGAYLYWQYPQFSPAPGHGGLPPNLAAAAAPDPLPAPRPAPPAAPAAAEAAASDASPADERQTPPPPAAPLAEPAPKEAAVAIRRSTHKEQVAPALARGYSAFMAGDDGLAQQEYAGILRHDGNNRDALLGMAAIAAKHGRNDEAAKIYLRLQELDPRDAAAHAGILALTAGQADPVQSESRVKILLAQQPDAHFLHFTLGNLYAGQSRWAEAQQAFFHAYQKAPGNPDYLYNLAVSLDHLNQGKLALEYYQRALAQPGPANFDKAAAQNRARELHMTFHGREPAESRSPLGQQPAGD